MDSEKEKLLFSLKVHFIHDWSNQCDLSAEVNLKIKHCAFAI